MIWVAVAALALGFTMIGAMIGMIITDGVPSLHLRRRGKN